MTEFWVHASCAYDDMAQTQWFMWSLALWGRDISHPWWDLLTYDHLWLTYFLLKISFISIIGPYMTDFGLTFILILHTEWAATSTTDVIQIQYNERTLMRGGHPENTYGPTLWREMWTNLVGTRRYLCVRNRMIVIDVIIRDARKPHTCGNWLEYTL
jgi:hypothetical protein